MISESILTAPIHRKKNIHVHRPHVPRAAARKPVIVNKINMGRPYLQEMVYPFKKPLVSLDRREWAWSKLSFHVCCNVVLFNCIYDSIYYALFIEFLFIITYMGFELFCPSQNWKSEIVTYSEHYLLDMCTRSP